MDFGVVLLVAFFAWLAWLLLRSKQGKAKVCPNCGHYGPTKTKTRGSILIEIVLWICFIVPGLIYSIWRHTSRKQVCSACGSETLVPADTPVGRKLLAEHSQAPKT